MRPDDADGGRGAAEPRPRPRPRGLAPRVRAAAARAWGRVPPGRRHLALALGVAALVAWMVAGPASGPRLDYRAGDVVRAEVVAPFSFSVADAELTERLRAEAADRVHPVFDYDPAAGRRAAERLAAAIGRLPAPGAGRPVGPGDAEALPEDSPDMRAARALAAAGRDPALEREAARAVEAALTGYVISDDQPALPKLSARNAETGDVFVVPFRDVARLSDARAQLRAGLGRAAPGRADRERLAADLESLVVPNLVPNDALTRSAREVAREAVPAARDEYRTGEIVAYTHQRVDARLERVLAALHEARGGPGLAARWFGALAFTLVLLYAFWRFAESNMRTGLTQPRAFALAALAILMQVALVRFGLEVATRFGTTAGATSGDAAQYHFAIPYAVASLAVALLVDGSLALVVGLGCALLTGFMASGHAGGGLPVAVFAATSAAAAVQSATRYQTRQAVSFAAVFLAAAHVGGVGVVTLMTGLTGAGPRVHLTNVGCAVVGALLTAAVAALVLPVFEWGFDLLTDVRLLELANAERPVLRELAMRAPGTHQHSYLVSTIATEAAKAIGANALLARIGAYYHDIGKLHAPHMFIENQMGGPNPHDRIKPAESAKYIVRHVTWGVRRAKEEGLPPQIAELITGHHGTRVIHYFYDRARREAGPGAEVSPDAFRYPGPKPQTKESAILMLADAAEAAVRSLEAPGRDEVEAIIHKIADAVVADGQLDECGMTLAEVSAVRAALTDALVSLYHRRVSYPGFNPPNGPDAGAPSPVGAPEPQAPGARGAAD